MPKVERKMKIKLGAERRCGVCNVVIEPGQYYLTWSFRYGGSYYRCTAHPPKRSELTQSKMSAVYDAIENAETQLVTAEDVAEVKALIEAVADVANEIASEYEEAAEPFGGQGDNQERADELSAWADELSSFDPDEPELEELDADEAQQEAAERVVADPDLSLTDAMTQIQEEWDAEHSSDGEEALEDIKSEAAELLDGCPL